MPIPEGYKAPRSGGDRKFDAIPDDMYQFFILDVDVKSVGTWDEVARKFDQTKKKDVYSFPVVFLDDVPFDGPLNGAQNVRGRRAWVEVNPFCSPASTKNGKAKSASSLYVLAKAAFGRDLTPDECEEITNNPTPLVGRQFKATAITKEGSAYADVKVATALRAARQLPPYDYETEGPNAGKAAVAAAVAAATAETADDFDPDEVPF